MALEKFGQDKFLPEGEWARMSDLESVSGLQSQQSNVLEFAKAVKLAEKKRLEYGVELELERDNREDPNAIKVIGFAENSGWFGRTDFQDWHIGYLGKDLAKKLHEGLLANNQEIAAVLHAVLVKNGEIEIKLTVVSPSEDEPTKQ